ncbi:MAG: collagen-like protein [Cyclobacteriaceae bacterium]|nr:collagen-like protein [Cyclobacteriaceae bacterium]
MKRLILSILLVTFALPSPGQKVKSKDVKRAVEQGKVAGITLLIGDQFTPDTNMEFDLQVKLDDGIVVLASDHHLLWDYATVDVDNTPYKIKGEFLANGKGIIKPRDPSAYYPNLPVRVAIELAGKKVEKSLTPLFCYPNLVIRRSGSKGTSGSRGGNGSYEGAPGDRGEPGENGERGPDISLEISEEEIEGKTHVIVLLEGKKYPIDPSCSKVMIVSSGGNGGSGGRGGRGANSGKDKEGDYTRMGGNGGEGGRGGNGGDGGNITVSGIAYEKYKSILQIESLGGSGGEGAFGGDGGNGKSDGRSGRTGTDGKDGRAGQVVIKN